MNVWNKVFSFTSVPANKVIFQLSDLDVWKL